MALDYRKCAEEIAALIGGGENVVSAAHCATRLRLVIADNDKVQTEKLEEVEGVQGLFESNGQLQLIIGTGTVNKVYDEFLSVTGASAATKEDVKAAAASKMPIWKKMLKSLGDVFVPILPAIVASGLMMGLVEFLGKAIPAFNDSARARRHFRGPRLRRKPVPGRRHRYAHDPPRPRQRVEHRGWL